MKKQLHHPSICLHRWGYPVMNLSRSEFKYCCKTPPQKIDFTELQKKGIDYFANNDFIVEKRKEMLRGVRHKDCSACWQLEDQGVKSFRADVRDFLKYTDPHWENNFESVEKSLSQWGKNKDLSLSQRPMILEVQLNNTCNMKCVYCNHHFSSLWAKEKLQYGEISKEQWREETSLPSEHLQEAFWSWLDSDALDTLDTVSIVGGEPLLTPDLYIFIEKLLTLAKKRNIRKHQIDLSIVTNLNLNKKQMDKFISVVPELNEIFNFKLHLSMDSTEQKAEYIRCGLDWKQWTENVDDILKLNLKNLTVSFLIAMSCLNISSIKDFLVFAYQKHKKFHCPIYIKKIVVTHPEVHSYLHLPASFSSYLKDAISFLKTIEAEMVAYESEQGGWMHFRIFLEELEHSLASREPDKQQMQLFYEWFSNNDRKRGSSITKIFPELTAFWQQCAKQKSADL